MRFKSTLKKLGITWAAATQPYNDLLVELENSLGSREAFAAVAQQLYPKDVASGCHPVMGMNIPGYEIDFTFGAPAYSNTARLLLRVPSKFRDPDVTQCTLDPVGPQWQGDKLGWGGSPLPEKAVLIYPNQEGQQDEPSQRPVVHWAGVAPGEYVIAGHIYNLTHARAEDIIHGVIGGTGGNAFEEYEARATVEDLRDILRKLHADGYTNFYSTDQQYVDRSEPVHTGGMGSGFRARAQDKERASSVYIPGDVRLGYSPQEEISNGGFAVKIVFPDGQQTLRPISSAFMAENYFYRLDIPSMAGRVPVVPSRGQLYFIEGHPMRNRETHLENFLEKLGRLNRQLVHAAP